MSSSQHLLVLMSIILGFGLRELLSGARAAATSPIGTRGSMLSYLAGILVLITIVQFWWYLFIVANRELWGENFFLFAATLSRPALLFLSAASVFPSAIERGGDPSAHYFRNRRFIYLPLSIFEAQNLIESAQNLGTALHPAHAFHLFFIAAGIILAVSKSAKVHYMLLAVLLPAVAVFIALFSLRLA